jgi:hypothetical protein
MTETDTVDYTDDSFQLDVIIEDFNSIQPPILPIDKESIDLTIFSTIVAPGKNSRSWRQHLYPFLLSNVSMP